MQREFRALLTGSAAVAALVSAQAIAWGAPMQGTRLPAVALHLIDDADGMTMQGPDGLWQGRVQVDVYALSYGDTRTIADAVIAALHGFRGGGFRGIFLAQQRDRYETGASDRPFRISIDFMTHWRAE